MENGEQKTLGKKRKSEKAHFILISLIRAFLLVAFIGAVVNQRWLILFVSIIAFFITFIPGLLDRFYGIKIPADLAVMTILFIYGTLFFGEVRGFYARFWWWGTFLNMVSAIALGLVGLTILYALYKDKKIRVSPGVVAIFAFSFAVAIGSLWEVFEFAIDQLFGFSLQGPSLKGTMEDLMANVIGAFLVSLGGYFYIKHGKINIIGRMIDKFVEKNPRLFQSKSIEDSEEIMKLIKKGEDKRLEFKSTLRTNIHTNEPDKKIEHAVLKTLVAYLNSDGGTLLVGVSDDGRIFGTEKDKFINNDKLNLHFTNMIRYHIGNEYLPFIKSEIVAVNEKHILKIDCEKSNKRVFLKMGGEEEFFVRSGPATVKLSGSALIDYVNHRFNRN